ncbi:hypothetical protein EVAR_95586_1 [Eumeta japonica]|uniref:Uncharacterized protein n=1 Tax=Eumeta variegata TaxID=151549 RepID=A0A4C1VL05_EUMVA|nr:hypothetical protein EVAR_95586_1 [Eumeta japonica]
MRGHIRRQCSGSKKLSSIHLQSISHRSEDDKLGKICCMNTSLKWSNAVLTTALTVAKLKAVRKHESPRRSEPSYQCWSTTKNVGVPEEPACR